MATVTPQTVVREGFVTKSGVQVKLKPVQKQMKCLYIFVSPSDYEEGVIDPSNMAWFTPTGEDFENVLSSVISDLGLKWADIETEDAAGGSEEYEISLRSSSDNTLEYEKTVAKLRYTGCAEQPDSYYLHFEFVFGAYKWNFRVEAALQQNGTDIRVNNAAAGILRSAEKSYFANIYEP